MINLLPAHEKKRLQKEFRLRFGVTLLFALLFVEVCTFVALAPSYLALKNSTAALADDLAAKKSTIVPGGDATQNELAAIQSEMTLLKGKGGSDWTPSQLLSLVLADKPIGVMISRYTYARSDTGFSVQLSGVADRPEDLILFRKLIKDDKEHVKEAKYAQSFISKKTNIDFVLTVDFK
jgi:hypothetical protein